MCLNYDVQVRMDGKWQSWVKRGTLATARQAARQLRLSRFTSPEPWWDAVRYRPYLRF